MVDVAPSHDHPGFVQRWFMSTNHKDIGILYLFTAGIVGLIAQYIVIVSAVTAAIVPMAFLFAILWGRAPLGRFSNAISPVLAVAISSRSSLASLPLMVERLRERLSTEQLSARLDKLLRFTGNKTRQELLTDIGLGKRIANIVAKRLLHLLVESGERPDALLLTRERFTAIL